MLYIGCNPTQRLQGVIVNVLSFHHPHVKSIIEEGLWGFPGTKLNRTRWDALKPGATIFFYGKRLEDRGIFLKAKLRRKEESHDPVKYWNMNPIGYPYQIHVEL